MKAPAFRYARPTDLEAALELLDRHGADAQILAGGQSLIPSLNLRLSSPGLLIDINQIEQLKGIGRRGEWVRIGALARHADVAESEVVRADLPLVAEAITHVAHPAVRTRGTFGGSLALGDPAAELPACAVALGARLVLAGATGRREVAASEFYTGLFETDRRPGEILIEALIPRQQPAQRSAFLELSRRHGDFAVAGIACQASVESGLLRDLRLVVFGCEPYPHIARRAAETALGQGFSLDLGDHVAAALQFDLDPIDDLHGNADIKRHWAGLLARRAMARLAAA